MAAQLPRRSAAAGSTPLAPLAEECPKWNEKQQFATDKVGEKIDRIRGKPCRFLGPMSALCLEDGGLEETFKVKFLDKHVLLWVWRL